MLVQLLFFSVVIFAVGATLEDIIEYYPEECEPTFSMFDASGKIPSGIFGSGNFVDLGNFDQCLGIDEKNNKSETIIGKYCVVQLSLPIPTSRSTSLFKAFGNNFFRIKESEIDVPEIEERVGLQGGANGFGVILGWCVPHTCPIYNLSALLSTALHDIDPSMKVTPLMGGMCQTRDDLKNEYSTKNIIIIIFLAITLFLLIISTLYDVYLQHTKKKPAHIILIAFSVLTNGQKLLSVSNNPDQLPCLNGIRLISMIWVVYGHRLGASIMEPVTNAADLQSWLNKPANMYMINAPLSVDSFLVLSGILLTYGYCLAKDKGVKFNIILFYVHRYLRLTPVLAVLVWIHATIIGFFGSGPFWPSIITLLQGPCIDYWWSPLVYAQNYYNTDEMCLKQTWYLSVDMQLFIVSPIILIPLWKWPKKTLLASTVLVLGSTAISFAVTYAYDLPASGVTGNNPHFSDKYYYPMHTRFGPYLMGLMLGYYLFKLKKTRNTRISLHPAQVAFGWIVGMGLILSTLYAGHDLFMHSDKLGNSFFNGLHRHGWALGLCWIVYACTEGYGGPINAFLSWSPFQILGRFTYTVYLVHYSLQSLILGSSRTSTYFSDFNSMYKLCGDVIFSLAIAVCLTLAYESPMVTIEKVLFKKGPKPKKPELPVHHKPSTSEGGQTNNGFVGDENKQR